MTPDQRLEINIQNASHSTGPKTDEGKAISSQNALKHGLSASKIPQNNPAFLAKLTQFQQIYPLHSPLAQLLILQIAHLAFKLEQIPQIEYEIELNSPLTLAEHFMQDKPTPLTRLWNLELRLQGRFNTLLRQLIALKKEELQNEPTLGAPSSSSGSRMPPMTTQNPKLQNEPKKPLSYNQKTFNALNKAIQSLTQLNL